ncbi:aldose 1-epimerase [Leptospira sp. 96542]|nr:aldose 1-epimerase [Leptospira sp. 96542]
MGASSLYKLKTKTACFEIHPSAGGQWLGLVLASPVDGKPISVVAGHKAPDPFFASGSFLMFPWVNRLEPNPWAREPFYPSTHWLTDGNGISLHGLYHNLPRFIEKEILSDTESYAEFSIEIPESWKGSLLSKIQIRECYVLHENELIIQYKLKNNSNDEFPFALGIHPYFRWNDDNRIDDLFLFGSGFYKIKLGDYLLPERVNTDSLYFITEETLNGKNLDDLYKKAGESTSFIGLMSMNRKETLIIQGGEYYQIYTPQDRKSIAIEPMTGTGNFLHFTGGNPNVLMPNEEKKIEFLIRLHCF